jgi:hypothetical protein
MSIVLSRRYVQTCTSIDPFYLHAYITILSIVVVVVVLTFSRNGSMANGSSGDPDCDPLGVGKLIENANVTDG